MPNSIPVLIPLLNPNEPEAFLAAVYVQEGQHVTPGDLLFSVETTKSASEVNSEAEGYVTGLRFHQGQTAHAGDVFCHLSATPMPQDDSPILAGKATEQVLPPGLRITQPALALAQTQNMDLTRLPVGPMVTESLVRSFLAEQPAQTPGAAGENHTTTQTSPAFPLPDQPFDPTRILIYGGGGHGKIVIDLLKALGVYRLEGIVDDGRNPGETVLNVPVLGGEEALADLFARGIRLAVNGIGGIHNINVRIAIFQRLAAAGFACPTIVHPTAYIEPSAESSAGTQVLAHAYLGSASRTGFGVIISTGAIVSHDCTLGNYVNISPGAILAGEVQVGEGALIGMGVTVNLGVQIGAGARIGNGSTVNIDVPAGGVVRAGTTWPR